MADWDRYFPPITKERLATIWDVSPSDKQKMKGPDVLDSILWSRGFYRK